MSRIIEQKLPTIALVGRVNVGKSTLFNRLIGERKALISPTPGTTRTRNRGIMHWRGLPYRVIDTGGLTFTEGLPFEKEIMAQVEAAIGETDLILFLVDVNEGVLPQERMLAKKLQRVAVPIILVANKSDSPRKTDRAYDKEWRVLGFGAPHPISAVNGYGIGDLLDECLKLLPLRKEKQESVTEESTEVIRVALIGRPNVGKSTLFNTLIGEERVIVSSIPHTTRESHDTHARISGRDFLFIDTAGIRRKARIGKEIEEWSVEQSLRSVQSAHVVVLILDMNESLSVQDKQLARMVAEHGKGCIIVLNKWDLFEKSKNLKLPAKGEQISDAERGTAIEQFVLAQFPSMSYAPIVRISAKEGTRISSLIPLIVRVAEARKKMLSPEECAKFLRRVVSKKLPVRGKGVHHPKLLGLKQVAIDPPTFEVAIKVKTSLAEAYLKFLARMLREQFDFFGTPVVVYVKKMKRI